MKRKMLLCLMTLLLSTASGVAQSPKQPRSTQGSNPATDIRKVDFLNFTYNSTLCSKEYGKMGIGKTVRVRAGEFKTKNAYFAVSDGKVIYGDMTGDGVEDAVVRIGCGATMANFGQSEIKVYTVQNGRATLLAAISDKEMERDYRSHYPDAESYWGISDDIKVNNGNLEIDVLTDGSHAAPQYVASLQYKLSGGTLGLTGKPARKNFSQ